LALAGSRMCSKIAESRQAAKATPKIQQKPADLR
jgi:hypothetical protein